jgi:hypothetical protein
MKDIVFEKESSITVKVKNAKEKVDVSVEKTILPI